MSKDEEKDEDMNDERVTDSAPTVDYAFILRSLTLRDVGKVPGPVQYSSREFGVPFATFELGWSGRVRVPTQTVEDSGDIDDLRDLETIGLAVKKLMRWLKGIGKDLGKEIVTDIKLDVAEGKLDDRPGDYDL